RARRARSPRGGGLARVRQRRQDRLDLVAQVLERRRQRQALAEVLERLVGREARAERRDLEEDAARLAEVDRLEVEAVDDRRHVRAGLGHALAPRLVFVGLGGPGHVMNGARAADSRLVGDVVVVRRAAPVAADLPFRPLAWFEAERLL